MIISGKTKIVALLGYPVGHSMSPHMHNSAFEKMGIDYCYTAFAVRPEMLKEAVLGIRALNLAGVNVTIPHKEKVMQHLNLVDSEASFIGAVNTVKNENGRLTGHNTDGRGFMRSLEEAGISPEGRKIMIIGSGGGARAISHYLSEKASGLYLFDIDGGKADRLKNDLLINGKEIFTVESPERIIEDMDIIINATPLGLKPDDPMPFDTSKLTARQVIGDLIYKETPLQRNASSIGCKTFNGLGMLLWQGVFSSEIWTGIMPPVEIMRKALLEQIA